MPAPLIAGRALLFYSAPCHLCTRICGPISYPYTFTAQCCSTALVTC
nr:MAG TPA: hypothetical protein [Caudoviricetes sp.]